MRYIKLYGLVGLLLLIMSIDAYAQYFEFTFSNVPSYRERSVVPRGYARCYIVPAGFYHGVWKSQHTICRYRGRIWISGHYECLKFRRGYCRVGVWVPAQRFRSYRY